MDRHQQLKRTRQGSNVIPFRLDAAFFFERAVRHLDRHNLQSALKYFRKAMEYEPDNPVNHCNLAGVLSEMGLFEESNQLLENVVRSIDPNMYECYFYMANNWANLGNYQKAEEYAARYLDLDPNGEFSKDAEEMLDILIEEFGGGEVLRQRVKERELERKEQDKARRLLEQGKFLEATAYLKNAIEEHPDLTAPRNNLSLAYYYLGQMDTAIEIAQEVLRKDPTNIHARCNLAVYYQHLGDRAQLKQLLDSLRNVTPLNFDQCYKLATTMGILGEHRTAHRLFLLLSRWSEDAEPALLHCVAASANNIGNSKLAKRIWQDIQILDPKGEVAPFYLKALGECEASGKKMGTISYYYQIPFHEQFKKMQEQLENGKSGNWRNDPLIRSSLFWALQNGDIETKIQVLQTFALIADDEVVEALRQFVIRPDEIVQLKLMAIHILHHIAYSSDTELSDLPTDWQTVLEQAWAAVQSHGSDMYQILSDQWTEFLMRSGARLPKMTKPAVWAAGLTYFVLQKYNKPVTQRQIADLFQVSVSAVGKISRAIKDTIDT
ncbi:tetratricopeptide repeat protein [Effusibacillus dendaii]|uniref:Tetratricopeptide repeat protein n=1 Tax=Effusibacillus dendaii TaxID=2743772 RepID=A0A7I8DJC2_9BACL|nr:tetratricopeptide repeat protein [Effusibacillus dendaii]BCJ87941.1 hypothetical protein skT53_29260 [Effusibacillus dendaii]